MRMRKGSSSGSMLCARSVLLLLAACGCSVSLPVAATAAAQSSAVRGGTLTATETLAAEAATITTTSDATQQFSQNSSGATGRRRRTREQRRRRAMNNNNNNRQGQQHHHNQHYQDYPSQSYYSQQQQQQKNQEQKYNQRSQRKEATLQDVWLCYAFALGWSMWFLSSFLNTDLMRFAESESVLVHGNVREVSIEDDSLGTGIPTYHALIDYIITVRREADAARIQVRKSFQTQHLLQQGFANVELLVLPEEPTSSVLKEDWQREVAAQEAAEEDIISIGGFGDIVGDDGIVGALENDGDSKRLTALSRVDVWAKRASLILSGILVTASLIGAVQAVHRIRNEKLQFFGWVSVVVGSVVLWPLAMFSLRIVSTCQRLGLPTEKSGIILKCDTNAQVGATINDNEEKMYTQHQDGDLIKTGNISTRHLDNVSHPDTFHKLKTPQHIINSTKDDPNKTYDSHPVIALHGVHNQSVDASADESACYFVKLPSGKKDGNGLEMVRLDDSSLSTISTDSRQSKSNPRADESHFN